MPGIGQQRQRIAHKPADGFSQHVYDRQNKHEPEPAAAGAATAVGMFVFAIVFVFTRHWASAPPGLGLLYAEQFDFEYQGRVCGYDRWAALRPVCEARRDNQLSLASDFHGHNAFVPALDDHAHPYWERKRLSMVERAIEFIAILQCADVMHCYSVTG